MVGQFLKIKKKLLKAKNLLKKNNLKHLCITATTNTSSENSDIQFAPLRQIEDILIFSFSRKFCCS